MGVELGELGVGEIQELIQRAMNIAENADFIKPAKDCRLFRQCKNLRLPLCHSPFTDKNHESGY
jgi:hypothetical protein